MLCNFIGTIHATSMFLKFYNLVPYEKLANWIYFGEEKNDTFKVQAYMSGWGHRVL